MEKVFCYIELKFLYTTSTWRPQKVEFGTAPKWEYSMESNILNNLPLFKKTNSIEKYVMNGRDILRDLYCGSLRKEFEEKSPSDSD